MSDGANGKPRSDQPENAIEPFRMRQGNAGESWNEVQADTDDKQSGPSDELEMSMNLNETIEPPT